MIESLVEPLKKAAEAGKILGSTLDNTTLWLRSGILPSWAIESLRELLEQQQWEELDNRFFKKIEFGTAGMRGRTIGKICTKIEKGEGGDKIYRYPAVGSACLNDFNVIWATIGLFKYCDSYLHEAFEYAQRPRLVIAHDTRYFSKHFSELVASTWAQLGGDAYLFDGPRSTPQLSFTVRHLKATAGVVITASHNPYYDNGYKVYFNDGAQVCDLHAKGIIKQIYLVNLATIKPFLEKDLREVFHLSPLLDESYMECVQEVVLDEETLKTYKPKIIFTPLHGTGAVTVLPLLDRFELSYECVEEQLRMDPAFPTVKFPNPEYKEALSLAIAQANAANADVVIATDPDADRMGVALKNEKGNWVSLSGNSLAVLLAEYRLSTMVRLKWLPKKKEKRKNVAMIKSFVTTPMLQAIADEYGIKMIDTLTGFKWIGAKLLDYELEVKERLRKTQGIGLDYDATTVKKRKDLLMRHSTFYVFGGEESYGYLANDRVRDKDANASTLMFCEFLAYLKGREVNFSDYLDDLYVRYGYFQEDLLSLSFEGASGVKKIENLLASYRKNPPKRLNNVRVLSIMDFNEGEFRDADGKPIPRTDFLIMRLLNGFSVAIRGSGTEPKVKMYLFGYSAVEDPDKLTAIKSSVHEQLEHLKNYLKEDAHKRANEKVA